MIACDLCALDCGSKPFTLEATEGPLHFCCEGCRGIYSMLNEINVPPVQVAQNDANLPEIPERKSP
jgi:hypothetical protein